MLYDKPKYVFPKMADLKLNTVIKSIILQKTEIRGKTKITMLTRNVTILFV